MIELRFDHYTGNREEETDYYTVDSELPDDELEKAITEQRGVLTHAEWHDRAGDWQLGKPDAVYPGRRFGMVFRSEDKTYYAETKVKEDI